MQETRAGGWFGGDLMAAQEGRKFTDEEAQRFAALMAGFDTGNASPEESAAKGQMMRRMVAEKGLRLVDAWELFEIRDAIDRQLQPVRAAVKVVREVEYVNEGCDCEPWPLQMFWFFVGVLAWMVSGAFWTLRQLWRLIVLMAVAYMLREMWRLLIEELRGRKT